MILENKNINYTSFISAGVWEVFLEELNTEYWINQIYKYTSSNSHSVQRSNQGGYHSESNIHQETIFFPLVEYLNKIHNLVFKHPNINISRMWINISNNSHYNSLHQHGKNPKKISGVLYLKIPLKSGRVNYHSPLDVNNNLFFTPKSNLLLLFNEILPHYVETNLSQEDRISIAYDC